jgi:catechol 2,3-dioxygenase-like lactoylglutathione lyase family enzyme
MDMKLELVPIPVTDVDRAKAFYADQVGFHVDLDERFGEELRVVQQVGESESFLLQRSVGVPEDQGDVDVSGTQHLQALDRVGIDEVQLDSRVRPGQLGGCLRYEGAEDRLETGESYPSGTKSHAGGQLDGCGVHSPQDLCRPSRQ